MISPMIRQLSLLFLLLLAAGPAWSQIALQSYRDSVYSASQELMNAEQAISKAEAAERLCKIAMLPSVSLDGGFSKTFRRTADNHLWGFSITPQITQPIFGSGLKSALHQAQSLTQSAQLQSQDVMLSMRYAADFAYWNVSAMQLYMAATNEYVKIISSLYNVVKERFAEGYAAKSDMLQVEARLSDAEFSLLAARNNYQLAINRFNNLRGVDNYDSSPIELLQSIVDSIPIPQRVSAPTIISRRPDILSAIAELRASEFGVARTRAAYNPKINAGVSGSWQTFTPNSTGRTFLDAAVTVGVNIPIFHWNERRYAIREAQTDVAIIRNNVEQLKEDVAMQEANAWSALTSSYSQMQSSLHNLSIAGENLSISTYSYNEGQATVLDVLQAQISWIQIYTNAITARFNYAIAVSEYNLVTGLEEM